MLRRLVPLWLLHDACPLAPSVSGRMAILNGPLRVTVLVASCGCKIQHIYVFDLRLKHLRLSVSDVETSIWCSLTSLTRILNSNHGASRILFIMLYISGVGSMLAPRVHSAPFLFQSHQGPTTNVESLVLSIAVRPVKSMSCATNS